MFCEFNSLASYTVRIFILHYLKCNVNSSVNDTMEIHMICLAFDNYLIYILYIMFKDYVYQYIYIYIYI